MDITAVQTCTIILTYRKHRIAPFALKGIHRRDNTLLFGITILENLYNERKRKKTREKTSPPTTPLRRRLHKTNRRVRVRIQRITDKRTSQHQITRIIRTIQITRTNQITQIIRQLTGKSMVKTHKTGSCWT